MTPVPGDRLGVQNKGPLFTIAMVKANSMMISVVRRLAYSVNVRKSRARKHGVGCIKSIIKRSLLLRCLYREQRYYNPDVITPADSFPYSNL